MVAANVKRSAEKEKDTPAKTENTELIHPSLYNYAKWSNLNDMGNTEQIHPHLSESQISRRIQVEEIDTIGGMTFGKIRVLPEETLGHYADWLKVKTYEIRRYNNFTQRSLLKLNEEIILPLERVSKSKFEEKRLKYHKNIEHEFFKSYRIENMLSYTVRPGDSVWTISNQIFDAPLWLISKYNPQVNFSSLRHSQRLLIPVIVARMS